MWDAVEDGGWREETNPKFLGKCTYPPLSLETEDVVGRCFLRTTTW